MYNICTAIDFRHYTRSVPFFFFVSGYIQAAIAHHDSHIISHVCMQYVHQQLTLHEWMSMIQMSRCELNVQLYKHMSSIANVANKNFSIFFHIFHYHYFIIVIMLLCQLFFFHFHYSLLSSFSFHSPTWEPSYANTFATHAYKHALTTTSIV